MLKKGNMQKTYAVILSSLSTRMNEFKEHSLHVDRITTWTLNFNLITVVENCYSYGIELEKQKHHRINDERRYRFLEQKT